MSRAIVQTGVPLGSDRRGLQESPISITPVGAPCCVNSSARQRNRDFEAAEKAGARVMEQQDLREDWPGVASRIRYRSPDPCRPLCPTDRHHALHYRVPASSRARTRARPAAPIRRASPSSARSVALARPALARNPGS